MLYFYLAEKKRSTTDPNKPYICRTTTHHALIPCFLQGELSEGTSVLYHYLSTEPKKLMLIGPFDNNLAKTVAAYSGLPEIGILQVKFLNFLLHNLVCLYHYNCF